MIRSFGIDENNDLVLGDDRNLSIVTNLQAVLNVCEHAAKAIRNEMIYAQGEGMPDFETIWNGSPNPAAWEAAFRTRIRKVQDVTGIVSFTPRRDGDTWKYEAVISTVYGEGRISG